jgi:MFS family permease
MTPDSDSVRHQPSELRQHWGMVAASATLMSISSGVWYASSVLFVALIQEFHWDYGSTAGIFSTFILMYGVWGVLAGLLLDRFGPRRVILAGGVLLPVALASSGLATALPTLYLTHGVITPLGLSLMSYVPVSVLLTRNFYARRGLALGFASAGVGVGILIVVPLTQFLIDRAGWRMAYFGLAAIAASVVLPIALLAIREETSRIAGSARPRPPAASSLVSPSDRPEWTLASAIRSREFWLVTATFMCLNSPIQLVLTHQIAHLVEIGHSKILVAGIMGLVGLVSIPGKIWWGYLADRVWPEWIYLAGCAFVVAGIAVLLGIGPVSPLWHLYLYAALMGVGYAVSPAMTPIMCGLFFGGPHFGVIFGALNMLYHAGGASGVWLAGYAHDLTGNYRLPFSASMASATATVLLVWLVAPRRLRVRSAERQAPRQTETTQEPTTEKRSASRPSH